MIYDDINGSILLTLARTCIPRFVVSHIILSVRKGIVQCIKFLIAPLTIVFHMNLVELMDQFFNPLYN